MRGVILTEAGTPPELVDDLELAEPRAGEVRVRILASGVCHSDLATQTGASPWPLPAVMGHEGMAEVRAVGDGVDPGLVGRRCVISWVPHCGACFFCRRGEVHLCQGHRRGMGRMADGSTRFSWRGEDITGSIWSGTWTEETVLRASQIVPIDDDVPDDVGALIGCGVLTGAGAVFNTAEVRPGESAVVIGCGGVGLNVVQACRIAGASAVIAVDPVASKRERALALGATHACAPEDMRATAKEATGGIYPDVAFEVVGRSELQRAAHDVVRAGGRAVLVGMPKPGDDPTFAGFEQLFFREKRILPSYYGSCDPPRDVPRLVALWRAGLLDLGALVTGTRPMDEAAEALDDLARGEVVRTVLKP